MGLTIFAGSTVKASVRIGEEASLPFLLGQAFLAGPLSSAGMALVVMARKAYGEGQIGNYPILVGKWKSLSHHLLLIREAIRFCLRFFDSRMRGLFLWTRYGRRCLVV